jgi:2-dehydro-3-deoxygluconokinase
VTVAPEAVTCGEAMLMLLAEPGVPLDRAVHFRRSVTGPEAVVATGLARLGHRVRFLGRLGADPAGQAVLREMRADGIDVSAVGIDPGAPTGLLLRDSHPQRGTAAQYYREATASCDLTPQDVTAELVAGARLVHLSGVTPMLSASAAAATRQLIDLARQEGAALSLDPAVRPGLGTEHDWMRVVGPLLSEVDMVLADEDELELLLGGGPEEAAKALLGVGKARTVVVKRRGGGCMAIGRAGRWAQEPLDAPVTDRGGSSEAFAAGWLSACLRGLTPPDALAEAACAAALAAQSPSDTDGLPDPHARARALAALQPRPAADDDLY